MEAVDSAKKTKKKLNVGQIVLLGLCGLLLALIIGLVVLIVSKPTLINGVIVDILLVRVVDDKEIECKVDADIKYGTFNAETEARFWRTEVEDDLTATMVEVGEMQIYFIDGCMFLENGRGFKTEGKGDADYSKVINALPDLLDGYSVNSRKNGGEKEYYVVVTGDGAIDFVTQLYPDYADRITDVDDIEITIVAENWKIRKVRVEGGASLDNGNDAELDATITIIPSADREEHTVPQEILDALDDDIEKLTISQEMIDFGYAVSRYYSKDPNAAQIAISTDVAFFDIGYDKIGWYRLKVEDEWINYVSALGQKYYYNGNGRCNAHGGNLKESENTPIDLVEAIDSVYDIFLEKKFSTTVVNDQTIYQVDLDDEDISKLVSTYLPKFSTYADKIDTATATVTVEEGQVVDVSLVLSGNIRVFVVNKDFNVFITFTPIEDLDSVEFDVPDEVIEALIGK